MIQGIFKKISLIGVLAFICFLMGQNTASAQILPIPNHSFSCASNAVAPLDSIKDIQTYLNCNGFNPGPIDGDFGNRTTSAIKAFQAASGLAPDGVVGPATKQAMRSYSE
ncbi:MAG: peptidoglycan-binding domain-containing protein, partial [Candidatus Actinomarina sp.]|nr:peptidoglycan-binding domain-containing protein [Candidatus Actinomarina sp.]